ncbi:hypothetical protein [Actinomadura roseirufa]|uniref:hypothetical protein n=1 Tax=Actinomadura roseirufa TaxID=2094049 RepID=UPI001A9547DF|nr:hypothetical protein [Actinomadura roseirufa]
MSEEAAAGASPELVEEIEAVLDRIRALTLSSATGSLATDDRQSNAEEYAELVSYLARKTQIGYRYVPAKLEDPHQQNEEVEGKRIDEEADAARQAILAAIQNELQASATHPEALEQLAHAFRMSSDLFLVESNLFQEVRSLLLTVITAEASNLSAGESAPAIAQLARAYHAVAQARQSISLGSHVPTNGFYVVPADPDLVTKDGWWKGFRATITVSNRGITFTPGDYRF